MIIIIIIIVIIIVIIIRRRKLISVASIYHTRWERRASVCIEYGGYRTSCTGSTPCNIDPGVQSVSW